MFTVQDVMTPDPMVLSEEDDLLLAEEVFQMGRLRHLPVTRDGKLVGLVSQRDFLRAVANVPGRSRSRRAREVMTRRVTTVRPETSLRKALRLMVRNKFGCLPVVSPSGALVGIFTEGDAAILACRLVTDLDQASDALQRISRPGRRAPMRGPSIPFGD